MSQLSIEEYNIYASVQQAIADALARASAIAVPPPPPPTHQHLSEVIGVRAAPATSTSSIPHEVIDLTNDAQVTADRARQAVLRAQRDAAIVAQPAAASAQPVHVVPSDIDDLLKYLAQERSTWEPAAPATRIAQYSAPEVAAVKAAKDAERKEERMKAWAEERKKVFGTHRNDYSGIVKYNILQADSPDPNRIIAPRSSDPDRVRTRNASLELQDTLAELNERQKLITDLIKPRFHPEGSRSRRDIGNTLTAQQLLRDYSPGGPRENERIPQRVISLAMTVLHPGATQAYTRRLENHELKDRFKSYQAEVAAERRAEDYYKEIKKLQRIVNGEQPRMQKYDMPDSSDSDSDVPEAMKELIEKARQRRHR